MQSGRPKLSELAADEAGIRDTAGANDSIESFIDYFDEPVRELEIEMDLRIRTHECV